MSDVRVTVRETPQPCGDSTLPSLQRMSDNELRAGVNEFTKDDPPPYDAR